jgi:hypothetical protein
VNARWPPSPRVRSFLAALAPCRTARLRLRCDFIADRRTHQFPDPEKRFAESSGDNLLL